MNIFIGFGYNENDKWIKDLVFPLVKAFDADVSTGEDMHGETLSEGVATRIKNADGVLAFMTPRNQLQSGKFTTHQWVRDELVTALAYKKRAVEIRANQVEGANGIVGDRQRIVFDPADKALLMVELTKVLSVWRRNLKARRLVLMPIDIMQEVRPYVNTGEVICKYQFMTGDKESDVYTAKTIKLKQGLGIDIYNVPADESLVQITLKAPNLEWSSDYTSVHVLFIDLQKN